MKAITEFDRLGAQAFLKKYSYGKSTRYDLIMKGKSYPPKAIYGVAMHDRAELHRRPFWLHGGIYSNRRLSELGFEVVPKDFLGDLDSSDLAGLPRRSDDYLIKIGVRIRRGQKKFRNLLRRVYGDKCAVTGCSVVSLLEAAHVKPYSASGDYSADNGILLRTDIHTLFDLDLVQIDPLTRKVLINSSIMDASYRKLHGLHVREPSDLRHRIKQEYLTSRWDRTQ